MSEFHYSSLILISEIAIVLLAVVATAGFIVLSRRQKKHAMVKDFVSEYKVRNEQRDTSVCDVLKKFRKFDEEMAIEMAKVIRAREKRLYKTILNAIMNSNSADMREIDEDVLNLMKSCLEINNNEKYEQELRAAAEENAAKAAELEEGQMVIDAKELERMHDRNKKLYKENERLSGELRTAMETMEAVMKEYTAMYAGQSPKMEELNQKVNKLKENTSE